MIAVSRLLLDNIAEHQGLLDHDGHAARAGRAPLRRERRPGHGRARGDLPGRRRDDRDRAEDRGARALRPRRRPHPGAARHALQRAAAVGRLDDPARPHLVREHGAGLLPRRRRGRGGRRRPDRAEPDARSPASSTLAPISSIEYARNADRLRLLPRLCVSSEGAVDSIQLVSRMPLERVRTVAVTPESATSVVLTKVLLPRRRARAARRGGRREAADRRRGAEARVRGPDAALRPRPALARADRAADGVRGLGRARAAAAGIARARGRARRVGASAPAPSPSSSPTRRAERYGYPAGFLARYFEKLRYRFGPRERAGLYTFLELARDAASSTTCPSCASSRRRRRRSMSVAGSRHRPQILEKALDGERITDADALALLESRDLVAVGRAAERAPRPPDRPRPRHVHHRPQPQLHEHLRHRLRLLRLLPPPGRHARGLPAAEAGDLQEDRGDARARRHRRC